MPNQSVKHFVKILESIDRSKRRTEVFRDFCEMAYCTLAKKACPHAATAEKLEEAYMQVVGRYRDKEDIRRMPELLGTALMALNLGGDDFLGSVAGEIGALDSGLGQFFTPYSVSRLLAEISMSDAKTIIEREGFLTLSEPAAGAGGMVLAAADVLESMGFDPARHLWVEAVELNRATFHMAYIQISARGIAGEVICGNSLSLKIFEQAYTAAAPTFFMANGHPFAKQRKEAQEATAKRQERENDEAARREIRLSEPPATQRPEQLSLFG